ncbi:protein NRT1/ PTR FAMILY 2.11-like [Coffea eugenioides]|uniref:protein NRT1/ PTR FAMILY 2.11-like n=1 Tax=Coffea eugenioides TaxID=49369 RepID=UPI000F60C652|nr:protein NRT1/ PTR FAMILY 2.11-like [Coffea eugenioides]
MSSSMKNSSLEKSDTVAKNEEIEYKGVRALPYIIGNEAFEKLGTIGTLWNLLVYLTTVFNMNTIAATNMVNIFSGTSNFGTLVGAFLCDTYFGRYNMLAFSSIASVLGMICLSLSAAMPQLHPPSCEAKSSTCKGPTAGQYTFLVTGFGFLVLGAAGIRPCNLAFGADQFNPNTESGRRGINNFFNWYYFTFTFAVMVSLTVIVYVQSNINWAIGLGIPAFLMFLSCVVFFVGKRMYVVIMPQGSPLTSIAQVMVAASKKRQLHLPDQPSESLFDYISLNSTNSKLPYTDQFKFLNRAAIITSEDRINSDGSASNPWKLCSIQQVEEMKCVVRVLPIWIAGIIYYVVLNQLQTFVVFQATQADRRVGHANFKIPAASYQIFQMLSLTIWIPIYDRIMIPCLRKITKEENGITILQRMGFGIIVGIATMILSGAVEEWRRRVALTEPTIGVAPRKGKISSLSASWFIPQMALSGISEGFTLIAQIEFFYKQFPENMRSFAGSCLFCGFASSNYLCSLIITVVHKVTKDASGGSWLDQDLNKARLDYFYYLIAALEVINFGYFMICATWYKYKGSQAKSSHEIAMEKTNTKSSPSCTHASSQV